MAVLLTKERKFKIMSKTVLKKCSPWSCPVFFIYFIILIFGFSLLLLLCSLLSLNSYIFHVVEKLKN